MAASTNQAVTVGRAQWPSVGEKYGVLEATIALTGTVSGESITVFSFTAPALLVGVVAQIEAASNASVTVDIGDAEDGTQYVNGQAADATAGGYLARVAVAPVLKVSGGAIVMSVDAATATAGVIRVQAVVADVGPL